MSALSRAINSCISLPLDLGIYLPGQKRPLFQCTLHLSMQKTFFNEYTVPTAGGAPYGIVAGPDGALWFAESNFANGKIGRITTAGVFSEYAVPTAAGSGPHLLTVSAPTARFGSPSSSATTSAA